jgi:hypothetical protein
VSRGDGGSITIIVGLVVALCESPGFAVTDNDRTRASEKLRREIFMVPPSKYLKVNIFYLADPGPLMQ